MDWVYAVLILAAITGAARMVMEYLNTTVAVRPRIAALEEEVVDLSLASNTEVELIDDVQTRTENARSTVNDLRRQTSEMGNRLQAERERKRRLEIAVFRKRLKSHKPLATAS